MDEDILQEEDHSDSDFVADRREKLDLCMVDVFHFIKRVHNIPIDAADDVHWLPETSIQNDLYETLKQTFDEQLLMAQDVSTVSFIWFYLCGLNETYLNDFLQWLWRWVVSPQMGQSTAKKSHGAACYLAGFLSRGHYISTELSKEWLLKMLQWASDYVKQQADQSRQSAIGLFKHGTFYAVCQAIFLVFCFRYKEFMGKDRHGTNEINQWNLGHIVHSSLCPLRFVAWQVALCFASISRSLQLVYCAHVLDTVSKKANDGSTDAVDTKNAFEGFFPFDPYRLPRSADNVRSLYRHFSPLVSDASSLADEMKWNRARVARQYKTSIGPDEDDFLMDVLSTSVGDKDKENYLTLYAASPGLRQLSDSLQMEM
uniref:Uncharacterized protein n=1 Tax=Plectus sambesii TaxID=2011161 RepID=A0A914W0A1_9BILA